MTGSYMNYFLFVDVILLLMDIVELKYCHI